MHVHAYAPVTGTRSSTGTTREDSPWQLRRRRRAAPRRRPSSALPWKPRPASSLPNSSTVDSKTTAQASAWPPSTDSSMRSHAAATPIRSRSPRLSSSAPARRPSTINISSASAAAPPSRSTRRVRTGCVRSPPRTGSRSRIMSSRSSACAPNVGRPAERQFRLAAWSTGTSLAQEPSCCRFTKLMLRHRGGSPQPRCAESHAGNSS